MKIFATKLYVTSLSTLPYKRKIAACTAHVIKVLSMAGLITIAILLAKRNAIMPNPLIGGGIALGASVILFGARIARITIHPDYVSFHTRDTIKNLEKDITLGKALAKEKYKDWGPLMDAQIEKEISACKSALKSADSTLTPAYAKKELRTALFLHCLIGITYVVLSILVMKNGLTSEKCGAGLLGTLIITPFLFEAINHFFTNDYHDMMRQASLKKMRELLEYFKAEAAQAAADSAPAAAQ